MKTETGKSQAEENNNKIHKQLIILVRVCLYYMLACMRTHNLFSTIWLADGSLDRSVGRSVGRLALTLFHFFLLYNINCDIKSVLPYKFPLKANMIVCVDWYLKKKTKTKKIGK